MNWKVLENLIVGTGPAGLSTAMALKRRNLRFEVVDVGQDLENKKAQQILELSKSAPQDWDEATVSELFPKSKASVNGVERRLAFGSDFPYRAPKNFSAQLNNCATEFSYGFGGFGNVWGAAMLPYNEHSLRAWRIPKEALKKSYRNVLQYIPTQFAVDAKNVFVSGISSLQRLREP